MKSILFIIKLVLLSTIITNSNYLYAETVLPTSNGIQYPMGLKNWRVISTSYRKDNNTQRVILGNSIAIKAAQSKQTNPWPQGTILAKLVWKNDQHPQWEAAIVPGEFVHSEIMIRDSKRFNTTEGWGYARWKGLSLEPYGDDSSFSQECAACHNHASKTNFVFTQPAVIP